MSWAQFALLRQYTRYRFSDKNECAHPQMD